MVHDVFLKYKSMYKFQIGDWAVLDRERVRIQNTYTARNGTPMYTVGSSKDGELDIEAEDIDNFNLSY